MWESDEVCLVTSASQVRRSLSQLRRTSLLAAVAMGDL